MAAKEKTVEIMLYVVFSFGPDARNGPASSAGN